MSTKHTVRFRPNIMMTKKETEKPIQINILNRISFRALLTNHNWYNIMARIFLLFRLLNLNTCDVHYTLQYLKRRYLFLHSYALAFVNTQGETNAYQLSTFRLWILLHSTLSGPMHNAPKPTGSLKMAPQLDHSRNQWQLIGCNQFAFGK